MLSHGALRDAGNVPWLLPVVVLDCIVAIKYLKLAGKAEERQLYLLLFQLIQYSVFHVAAGCLLDYHRMSSMPHEEEERDEGCRC